MSSYINQVTVEEHFLEEMLEVLGYPIVEKDIIYDIYNEDYIKNHIIAECLETFYNYFPIVKEYTFGASKSETSVDSPFENVLGIIHYSKPETGNNGINLNSGNPFYTASQVSSYSSTWSSYGTPFRYNETGTWNAFQRKFYNDSLKNLAGGTLYYLKFDEDNNRFLIRSVVGGSIHALIGCYSSNVSDIPKTKRIHFLNLCRAMLGLKFSKVVGLQNDSLPLEINWEDLKDSSQDLYDKEMEWLQNNSTQPIFR